MSTMSADSKANEYTFQNDMIRQLVANGKLLGKPEGYNFEQPLNYTRGLVVKIGMQQCLVI